jgi:predicted ATPase
MDIQLKVKNFRCLRNVDWSPDGVCVLVGPNGSGKTTLFDALSFFRLMYEGAPNQNQLLGTLGGPYFRNLDAPSDEPVTFSLAQGSWTWDLNISTGAGPFQPLVSERLTEDSETILSRTPGEQGFTFRGTQVAWPMQTVSAFQAIVKTPFAKFAPRIQRGQARKIHRGERPSPPSEEHYYDLAKRIAKFTSAIDGFVVYGSYANQHLRQSGSQLTGDLQMSPNGINAFAVLRNWRDKRDFRAAFDFVVKATCEAFPGVADEIDFDVAATATSLSLVAHGRKPTIPVAFAPNGWLAGLLHLMAVAGAQPGTVVAIDEFENSLHPYAIRRLVQAIRGWAEEKQLTVILAGHSSALLDEFKECPGQVFVMEPWRSGQPSMPLRLTDYRDPEWLKHFSLGELYRHEEFGGPKDVPPNGVPAASA